MADQDLVLPDNELELDNLTEYNTANNKRVTLLNVNEKRVAKKRKHLSVTFREEEDVINPEDIDPSVGKFRNLIQTAVIPNKRLKDSGRRSDRDYHILRPDHSDSGSSSEAVNPLLSATLSTALGIQLPNPAPHVLDDASSPMHAQPHDVDHELEGLAQLEKKKKYAKESWPGRKAALF